MEVEFTVDTYRDKVFRGKVEEIYPKPKVLNNVVYYIVVARGFKDVKLLRPEMTTHNSIIAGIKFSNPIAIICIPLHIFLISLIIFTLIAILSFLMYFQITHLLIFLQFHLNSSFTPFLIKYYS